MTILRDSEAPLRFDLGLFGLGYESRSIDCFEVKGGSCERLVAIGYKYFQEECEYQGNRHVFESGGALVREVSDEEFGSTLIEALAGLSGIARPHVLIDISVMSRHRLSKAIWVAVHQLPLGSRVQVFYNVAAYVAPPTYAHAVKRFGPIIEELNTVPGRLAQPVSMICGLGYERDKALGAIGSIDPDELFLMTPISLEQAYDVDSRRNNSALSRTYPGSMEITYEVAKPFSTYIDLKSLIARLSEKSRVLILPLGPKILSAISILLAAEFYPRVVVWRVSSEEKETPVNKLSSGRSLELTIEV